MSKTYRIHGARFLRKYTASERTSCYSYMADVRKIADSLCGVPWEIVTSDVAATTTIHTEAGLDWNAKERERFDAAEWCGEHSDGYHRAYAQAACYVFKLPTSAVGKAIEKIAVRVNSDPYNPYGARISAKVSSTLTIPTDCSTVRTGDVYRAPDANGLGAAPRLYVNNANGTQTWYANSERVELTPTGTLTASTYLFVFCCLENYNRGRDGWIEGSSYIENDVEITLSAAASDLDENELNDCRVSGTPTALKLVNIKTGATDATVNLSGPVFSMTEIFLGSGLDGRMAVIQGDFDEYSIAGVPGLVVWDYDTRQIVSVTQNAGQEISAGLKTAIRSSGVLVREASINTIGFEFSFVPDSWLAESRIVFLKQDGVVKCAYFGGSATFNDSRIKNELMITDGPSNGLVVFNDRVSVYGDGIHNLPKSGTVSWVSTAFSRRSSVVVAGECKIAGCESAVKFVTSDGKVKDDGLSLAPDSFESFKAVEQFGLLGWGVMSSAYRSVESFGMFDYVDNNDSEEEKFHYPTVGGKIMSDYQVYEINDCTSDVHGSEVGTVTTIDGHAGFLVRKHSDDQNNRYDYKMFIGANGISALKKCAVYSSVAPFDNYRNCLVLSGRFKTIGGMNADGAMILAIKETGANNVYHVQFDYIPLKIGEVKNVCLFADSTSTMPLSLSHALVNVY